MHVVHKVTIACAVVPNIGVPFVSEERTGGAGAGFL